MIVNQAAIDWVTITSYERNFGKAVKSFVDTLGDDFVVKMQARMLGYSGTRMAWGMGTIFLGQNLGGHWILTASGELAERIFRHECLVHFAVKCTRIDLQITVPEPTDWSQAEFARAVCDSGRFVSHSHIVSDSGETVYLGSRKSDSFVRVYQKATDDQRWLRYEIELKGDRSNAMYSRLRDGANVNGFIVDSVQRVGRVYPDIGLFLPPLGGVNPSRIRLVKELGNTERWFLNQVFPALQKAINGQNGDWFRDWLHIILGGGDSEPVA